MAALLSRNKTYKDDLQHSQSAVDTQCQHRLVSLGGSLPVHHASCYDEYSEPVQQAIGSTASEQDRSCEYRVVYTSQFQICCDTTDRLGNTL